MESDRGLGDLCLACVEGNREKVGEVLDGESVAINFQGENKETALHVACQSASCDDWIVRKLLEKGADPLLPTSEGKPAFHIACELGHSKAVGAILDHCREIEQKQSLLTATDNEGVSIYIIRENFTCIATASHESSTERVVFGSS